MKGMTDHDRRLIDEAVAAGMVTRVQTGVAATWSYPVWDGKKNALVYPDHAERVRAAKSAEYRGAHELPVYVRLRRAKVAALHADGLSIGEMVERLDVSYQQVYCDTQALGLTPHPRAPKAKAPVDPRIAARRARILELAAAGATMDDIAADIGLPIGTARAIACAIGAKLVKRPRAPRPSRAKPAGERKLPERVIELRARIAASIAEGMSQVAICDLLSLSREALRYNLHHMGIDPRTVIAGLMPRQLARRDDRRAQVSGLVAEGLTSHQIAARMGAKVGLIYSDLRALDLRAAAKPRSTSKPHGPLYGPPAPPQRRLARLARQEQVAQLHAQGLGRAAIRAALSIGPHVLRHDLRDLGLTLPREDHGVMAYDARKTARMEARRAKVAKAAAEGLTFDQVSARLGIAVATLRKDYAALGLTRRATARAAIPVDELRALRQQGLPVSAIANRLKVSKSTVHRLCQRLDLPNGVWRAAA